MPEMFTLQCWPDGTSYSVQGDLDGPKRKLKKGHDRAARWRKGTPAEWRAIKIERLAEMYRDRDVLACQSALVDDLINANVEGFSLEEAENLYPNVSEWNAEQCREWLDEHGHEQPARDEDESDSPRGYLTQLRDAVRDNAEAAEVFEWWLVTDWLCRQLKATGEVILDNGYGSWWGRTCTGQGLIMDGMLQRIAANYVSERE